MMSRFIIMISSGLHCGDCNTLLEQVASDSVDLVCFSPPYDDIRDYKGFAIDFTALGKNLNRVVKPGGVAAVVITDATRDGEKTLTTFRLAVDWVDNCGWRCFEHCIYSRHGRPGAWWNSRFRVDHEYILLFVKGQKPNYFNKEPLKVRAKHAGETWHGTTRLTDGSLVKNEKKVQSDMKCRGTIWHYATANTEGNKLKLKHPGTMPDELARDIVKCFCPQDGVVLDPTCGSGTTCVVASQEKRNYIGFDISDEYIAIAKQRIEDEVIHGILQHE